MAYVWHMTINFVSEKYAREFAGRFDQSPFASPHSGVVEPQLSVEHNGSGWEVHVCPYLMREGGAWHLNGHGGATTPEEVEDIDACAKVFYDRLSRLYDYCFALTGFEVGDWRSAGILLDDLVPDGFYEKTRGSHGWDGLVVSKDLYQMAACPNGFTAFQDTGYRWVPYTSIALSQ